MTAPAGALQGVRVLDLSGEPGQVCGKLLGDCDADVIKIEPSEGDEVRRLGPLYEQAEELDRSLYWHAMNTSKHAVTLNLDSAKGRDLLQRLLATADIVVESYRPGTLATWGLDFEHLHQRYPHLILASITPFGQTGPYAQLHATELETLALSGFLAVCGDPEMGHPEWTRQERFAERQARETHSAELDAHIEAWTTHLPAQEVMDRLQQVGVPAAMVHNAATVDSDPQLTHRQHYARLQYPRIGPNTVDNYGFHLSATPGGAQEPAPLLGQHNDYVLGDLLGMAPEDIERLKAAGVVAEAEVS